MYDHTSNRNHYSLTGVWISYFKLNLTEKESPEINNTFDGG
jgi:hypothetical protein